MATTQEVLNKAKTIRSKNVFDLSKGNVLISTVGGGVGVFIGYTRGYNLLLSFVVGATIGGLANYIISKKD
jgi:hypothetical protein